MTVKDRLRIRRLRSWDAYLHEVRLIDYKKALLETPLQIIDKDHFGNELSITSVDRIVGDPNDFKELYDAYELKNLCRGENYFETARIVMRWLTENTYYSGAAIYRLADHSDEILRYSFGKSFRYAINCRHKAIALTDLLCACGIKAYPVLLHSQTDGSHFVCHVWHNTLNKWVAVDPSFNAWFSFGGDEPLSVFEMRDIFLSGGEPLIHDYSFNHTAECLDVYTNAFLRWCLSNISTWQDCNSERRRSYRHFQKTDFSAALPMADAKYNEKEL